MMCRMVTEIATALVGSKVKQVTKDLGGAVGLDDDKEADERAAEAEAKAKIDQLSREQKRIEKKRKKEREEHHKEKVRLILLKAVENGWKHFVTSCEELAKLSTGFFLVTPEQALNGV